MSEEEMSRLKPDQRLIQLVTNLQSLTAKEIDNKAEQCISTIHEALKIICENKSNNDIVNIDLNSDLAEILAIFRNLIGLANDDKSKATSILTSIVSTNLLHNLVDLFASYTEHLKTCLSDKEINSPTANELSIVILLRILQLFHNLFNLHFSLKLNIHSNDFEHKFLAIFDSKYLKFLIGLYEVEHQDERLNGLLKKLCYVFTSNIYCYVKNCAKAQDSWLKDHSDENTIVWQHILNHVKLEISEWSLWIVFIGLGQDQFFERIYSNMDNDYRLLLLDIVLEFVEDQYKTTLSNQYPPQSANYQLATRESNQPLPKDCLTFMIEQLKSEIEYFLRLSNSGNADIFGENNVRLVCKLCSLLLKLSSIEDCRDAMQQENLLIELLVSLLKNIQILGKSNPDSVFAIRGQLKDVSEEENELSNPAYGFKRDIIGLIANIIYRNVRAQDYLRTSDGLAALLDCAKMDARNPFILQWSIFAIHNALETNNANQQFVAEMNRQGILQDELLERIKKN